MRKRRERGRKKLRKQNGEENGEGRRGKLKYREVRKGRVRKDKAVGESKIIMENYNERKERKEGKGRERANDQ